MITREEAYNIILNLNHEAYDFTYQRWVDADDDEELREDASLAQQEIFRELYDDLDTDTRKAIHYYVNTDEDFGCDFDGWYGD